MKKKILLLMLPALASCVAIQEGNVSDPLSGMVRFSVSSGYEPETRTSFSGEVSGDSQSFERIDWTDGDVFRVYSAEAETPSGGHIADYVVTAHSADGIRSTAAVRSDDPLLWGSGGSHTFYGLYPAPGAEGVDAALTMSGNSVEGRIPSSQALTLSGTVWRPDMHYAYMCAGTQVLPSPVPAPVSLVFRPLVTTFEISLLNFASDPVDADLSVLRLRSTAEDARLSGSFTAAVQADGKYTAEAMGEGSAEVSVSFPAGTRLSTTNAVTATLFAIPVPLTDLELILEFSTGLIRRLPLSDGGTPIQVAPGEKVYMDNVTVPDGWIYHIETTTPVVVTSHNGGSTSFTIESYRTKRGNRQNVVWNAEFSESEDGPFTDTPPEGFSLDAVSGDGTSRTVSATVGAQSGTMQIVDLTQPHRERLAANSASPRGTSASPFDLSMYNLAEDATRTSGEPVTANCYMVDRAGWYMFPLVYGNAIDYTKVKNMDSVQGGNTLAYMPPAKSYIGYMTPFRNAMGEGIVSPYILDDLAACGYVSAEALAAHDLDAVIVWQDVAAGKEIVSHPEILWTKPSAANAESGLPCPYIRFQVFENAANYSQGNALLAIRDISGAADKTNVLPAEANILWSWHIWITDEPVSTGLKRTKNNYGALGGNWMMPVNLGYCNPDSYKETTYAGRDCWVRLTQPGGNIAAVVRLRQDTEVIKETKAGSNPYYQFGRKDALLPADGTADGRNKNFVSDAGYTIAADDYSILSNRFETTDLEMTAAAYPTGGYAPSIRYPHIMLVSKTSGNWTLFSNLNLWNATNIENAYSMQSEYSVAAGETAILKSIYDPCPPGFSVASKCAFTFYLKEGRVTYTSSGMNLAKPGWDDGYWFKCENDEDGIFFPANGMRGTIHRYNPTDMTGEAKSIKILSVIWVPVHYYSSDGFFSGFSKDRAEYSGGVYDEAQGLSIRPVLESMSVSAATDGIDTKRYDMDGMDPGDWR